MNIEKHFPNMSHFSGETSTCSSFILILLKYHTSVRDPNKNLAKVSLTGQVYKLYEVVKDYREFLEALILHEPHRMDRITDRAQPALRSGSDYS